MTGIKQLPDVLNHVNHVNNPHCMYGGCVMLQNR